MSIFFVKMRTRKAIDEKKNKKYIKRPTCMDLILQPPHVHPAHFLLFFMPRTAATDSLWWDTIRLALLDEPRFRGLWILIREILLFVSSSNANQLTVNVLPVSLKCETVWSIAAYLVQYTLIEEKDELTYGYQIYFSSQWCCPEITNWWCQCLQELISKDQLILVLILLEGCTFHQCDFCIDHHRKKEGMVQSYSHFVSIVAWIGWIQKETAMIWRKETKSL